MAIEPWLCLISSEGVARAVVCVQLGLRQCRDSLVREHEAEVQRKTGERMKLLLWVQMGIEELWTFSRGQWVANEGFRVAERGASSHMLAGGPL